MLDELMSALAAIEAGDKARARRLLRPLLENPTAELWYVASQAVEQPEHEVACLQRALALDPLHAKARARLAALRGGAAQSMPPLPQPPLPQPPLEALTLPLKERKPRRRGPLARPGCLLVALLSALATAYFVASVLGLGIAGRLTALLSGAPSVREHNGVPVDQLPEPALVVPADQTASLRVGQQEVQVLHDGFLHEYRFEVSAGSEVAVYVQFLSLTAKAASRNVAVLDASGQDARGRCQRDAILQDGSGVIFTCRSNQSGTWTVRIFGRAGESSGAYFISVERLGGGP
ncbi:MAG: hypothetical protein ACUVSX_02960 [Aggregatilineales bacterium]